jgi:glycerol uptake facilitator-like aquaporin
VFIVETLSACLLLFVFSKISIDKSIPEYVGGLCIGATYYVITVATHQLTGAGVNPALTIPLNFVQGDFKDIVVYLVAPVLGALMGVFMFVIISSEAVNTQKARRVIDDDEMGEIVAEEEAIAREGEELIQESKDEIIKED